MHTTPHQKDPFGCSHTHLSVGRIRRLSYHTPPRLVLRTTGCSIAAYLNTTNSSVSSAHVLYMSVSYTLANIQIEFLVYICFVVHVSPGNASSTPPCLVVPLLLPHDAHKGKLDSLYCTICQRPFVRYTPGKTTTSYPPAPKIQDKKRADRRMDRRTTDFGKMPRKKNACVPAHRLASTQYARTNAPTYIKCMHAYLEEKYKHTHTHIHANFNFHPLAEQSWKGQHPPAMTRMM